MNEVPKIDVELRKALAKEAGELVENRVFDLTMRALHQQFYGQLMTDGLSDSKVLELVAKLRTLEAIPARLKSMAHDEDFAQKGPSYGRRRG